MRRICFLVFALIASVVIAQPTPLPTVRIKSFLDKDPSWFATPEGQQLIDNILARQQPNGAWHKNYNPLKPPSDDPKVEKGWEGGTIDNDATITELILLARSQSKKPRSEVVGAFNRGFDWLVSAQYPNGGWPQRFPLPRDYGRCITFNDDAMTEALEFMEDVAAGANEFTFVDSDRRDKAKQSFDKGIDCILKTQIKQNGQLTGWCQQYDPQTLEPTTGRTYELPSIAGSESATIAVLLMKQKNPSPEIRNSIHSCVAWFDRAKLTGIRVDRVPAPNTPKGYDQVVVEDASAAPIWARFYEIDTNKPFFCGRDGVKKYSLAEIELERRSGYAWLRPFGEKVLKAYPKWCAANGEKSVLK